MLPVSLPSGVPMWAVKLGGALLLVVALIVGYFAWANHQQGIGEARATEKYNRAIEAQKREASAMLAKETTRVAAAEHALQDFKNNQEVRDASNKRATDNLTARLRALAGPGGRLRDPHADAARPGQGGGSPNGSAPAGPGNRPDNGAEASGVLSAELTGLLQRLTIEADEINNAYISCRADAESVRAER